MSLDSYYRHASQNQESPAAVVASSPTQERWYHCVTQFSLSHATMSSSSSGPWHTHHIFSLCSVVLFLALFCPLTCGTVTVLRDLTAITLEVCGVEASCGK